MQQKASRPAILSWVLFDWAAQPYSTIITTFVFAPYFASALTETPAEGQALWGYATAAAGLITALLAPILGAIADATGHRKPWIFAFSIPLALSCWMLWYASPGNPNAVIIALFFYGLATLSFEFATVFNNAMMPSLVPANRIGRLSGNGWATGYAGGLVSLVIVLGFLTANPETGKTLLGFNSLFGLDASTREGDRAAGPFSAIWYVLFVLPMFLFTPDAAKTSKLGPAISKGLNRLWTAIRELKQQRELGTFLLSHMAYKDGLIALITFGGIYASGQLGWTPIQVGIFGIFLTIIGTIGAVIGGYLDDRFNPRLVLFGSLVLLMIGGFGLVSIDKETVFFAIKTQMDPEAGLFASLNEQVFLAFGGLIGAAAGPLQASSRTLLIQLSPPDQISQSFGLMALSGKATSFLAPLAVGLVTTWTANQAAGISVILAFFVVGGILLLKAKPR